MTNNKKQLRQQTQIEKDFDAAPACPYDVLGLGKCRHHEFPPDVDVCLKCIKDAMLYALEDRDGADGLRQFMAYLNFVDANYDLKPKKAAGDDR